MATKIIGPMAPKDQIADCPTGWCDSSMPRPANWGSPESAKSSAPKNPPKGK